MMFLDHVVVLLLLIAFPLYHRIYAVPTMRRIFAEDAPGVRRRCYWQSILFLWALAAGVLAIWFSQSRGAADLGLVAPGGARFWIALGAGVLVLIAIDQMFRAQARTPEKREELRQEIMKTGPFMPRNAGEMKHFAFASMTAGICEEIVYRGFLIWYASQFVGTSTSALLLAVLLTSVAFALGHLYQGVNGAAQVFVVGLVLGGLYVLSGSLWIPMVVHALMDVLVGLLTVKLNRETPPESKDGASTPTSSSDPMPPADDQSTTGAGRVLSA